MKFQKLLGFSTALRLVESTLIRKIKDSHIFDHQKFESILNFDEIIEIAMDIGSIMVSWVWFVEFSLLNTSIRYIIVLDYLSLNLICFETIPRIMSGEYANQMFTRKNGHYLCNL